MAADLLELAERCEKAEGPDRELDAAIFKATQRVHSMCGRVERCADCAYNCRPKKLRRVEPTTNGGRSVFWLYFLDGTTCGRNDVPYTASLDAALTLVPEGWNLFIGQFPGCRAEASLLECFERDGKWWRGHGMIDTGHVKAATPALALCAAALRARYAAASAVPQPRAAAEDARAGSQS